MSDNSKLLQSIERQMGTDLMSLFYTPNLVEIMLNPDGKVFYEIAGEAMKYWGNFEESRARLLINYIASYHGKTVGKDGNGKEISLEPFLECQFPLDGSRFTATLPPIVASPSFTIRKKAEKIYSLEEYVSNEGMTEYQKSIIEEAVANHSNIIIAGGTGSGKTTLVNAVIKDISRQFPSERLVILEDTGEIQCSSENVVFFLTSIHIAMSQLLKLSLRYYPKRILVGEVRDGSALDLLDAWNTGHSGGVATIHADTAKQALSRLYGLMLRNPFSPKGEHALSTIGDAIDLIVFVGKDKNGIRKVQEVLKVQSYDVSTRKYILQSV